MDLLYSIVAQLQKRREKLGANISPEPEVKHTNKSADRILRAYACDLDPRVKESATLCVFCVYDLFQKDSLSKPFQALASPGECLHELESWHPGLLC